MRRQEKRLLKLIIRALKYEQSSSFSHTNPHHFKFQEFKAVYNHVAGLVLVVSYR